MWLFIEPNDVWLFRDGKPFDAGADHRARSFFPPTPTTLQGAIRRKVLTLYNVDFTRYRQRDVDPAVADQVGLAPVYQVVEGQSTVKPGELGRLRLRGPFVARREAVGVVPYFPCPADVVKVENEVVQLRPEPIGAFAANWPDEKNMQPIVYHGEKKVKDDRYWLAAQPLTRYLNDEPLSAEDLIHEDKLFVREGRLGIGIDSSVKHVDEGLLYQVEYVRPQQDVGLLVEVTGIEAGESKWGKQGMLSLGGEMRAARYEVLAGPATWPQNVQGEQRFKLYLATPAYFKAGWRASQWDSLVAAAIGRAQPIGGWDVALNRQKAMRRYVPAGSVYYFEGTALPIESSIGDVETDRHIGFGQYFTGRW